MQSKNEKSTKKSVKKSTPENFSHFIQYGSELGTKLAANLNMTRSPYWVRCLESISFLITKQIMEVYEKNKIPEDRRFGKLRKKFAELYELYQEEFSTPFITSINGKQQINDEWLKFDGDIDLSSYDNDSEGEDNVGNVGNVDTLSKIQESARRTLNLTKKNRGVCITLSEKQNENDVDIEFPLSEMFHAALFIRNAGVKNINYPFCVLYFIYGCVYHSVENCHAQVKIELDKFREKSNLHESIMTSTFELAKKKVQPFLSQNSELIDNFSSILETQLDNVNDDDIDNASRITYESLNSLEKGNGGISSIFASLFASGDEEQIKEQMEEMGLPSDKEQIEKLLGFFSLSSKNKQEEVTLDQIIGK